MIIIEPIKKRPGLFTASTYRSGSHLKWQTVAPAPYSSIMISIIGFLKDCGGSRIYVKDRAIDQQYWLTVVRGKSKKKLIKPFRKYDKSE